MSNQYKKAMRRIEVPPGLLEQTAAKMKGAEAAPPKRPRLTVYAGALAACVLLVLVALPLLWQSQRDFLLTPLTPEGFESQVRVEDGLLVFDDSGQMLMPGLSFGLWSVEKQSWDLNRYLEYLGADPRPPTLPEGFAGTCEEAVVLVSEDGQVRGDELYLRYDRAEDSAWLEIYITRGKLPSHALPDQEPNSEINGTPAYATRTGGKQWRIQFVKDEVGYTILGDGITQEEFVRFVYPYFQ